MFRIKWIIITTGIFKIIQTSTKTTTTTIFGIILIKIIISKWIRIIILKRWVLKIQWYRVRTWIKTKFRIINMVIVTQTWIITKSSIIIQPRIIINISVRIMIITQ